MPSLLPPLGVMTGVATTMPELTVTMTGVEVVVSPLEA